MPFTTAQIVWAFFMAITKRSLKQYLQQAKNSARLIKTVDPRVIVLAIIPAVVVIVIVFSIISLINRSSQSTQAQALDNAQLMKPEGVAQINKNFDFTLKGADGKKVGTFSYTVQTAELDKQIIVKGSRATAIPGRVFLIVNLKLTNTQDQGLQVNTKDYLRLSVNGNTTELLAPEIHNDPVDVQAISTNFTRVGFAVYESDKNYVLKVGEIDGRKTDISLHFK